MTPQLDAQLQAKLKQCIELAEQAFSRTFPAPSLSYNVRGKAAGKAYLQLNQVRLNPTLLAENPQAFVDEVLPHEVAHLITHQVYGRVKPHGIEWQTVMSQVFGLAPRTTHSFSTQSVQGKTFAYQCQCSEHALGVRRHNRVMRNQTRYNCITCKQALTFTGVQLS